MTDNLPQVQAHSRAGSQLRSRWMRQDTAYLLKRFFFCERELLLSQAAWLPKIPSLPIKLELAQAIWESLAVTTREPPPVSERQSPAVTVHEPRAAAAARVPTVVGARPPIRAAVSPATSLVTRLSGLLTRLTAAWPQRRARGGFAWWAATLDWVRARRRKRRLRALLAVPAEYARRLRPWLARRGVKLTDRQWTLAVAVTTAVVLLAIALLFL